jgi:hypothetical protein
VSRDIFELLLLDAFTVVVGAVVGTDDALELAPADLLGIELVATEVTCWAAFLPLLPTRTTAPIAIITITTIAAATIFILDPLLRLDIRLPRNYLFGKV